MPQKKNPDAAELLRAKAPRVDRLADRPCSGSCTRCPLAYSKDLQEDKEPLFDAVDTLELCLEAAERMLAGLRFDRERLAAAAARRDARGHRDRRPAGPPGHALPRGPRRRRRPRADGARARRRALRARRRPTSTPTRSCSTMSTTRCCARAAWLESKLLGGRDRRGPAGRAARRGPGGPRGRSAPTAGEPGSAPSFFDALGARGRARADRLRALLPRRRRCDRRDRELRGRRSRLPRLRRPDPAHRDALRPAGPRLRLPLLRDPQPAQRRRRARGKRGGGPDPRARAAPRGRGDGAGGEAATTRARCARGPAS